MNVHGFQVLAENGDPGRLFWAAAPAPPRCRPRPWAWGPVARRPRCSRRTPPLGASRTRPGPPPWPAGVTAPRPRLRRAFTARRRRPASKWASARCSFWTPFRPSRWTRRRPGSPCPLAPRRKAGAACDDFEAGWHAWCEGGARTLNSLALRMWCTFARRRRAWRMLRTSAAHAARGGGVHLVVCAERNVLVFLFF